MPQPRYFSMLSIDVGAEVFRNRALNCWPWVRSLIHSPDAVIQLACRDRRRVANDGHQVAMSSGLRAENAEAVLGIVEGDALDQAGKNFLGR
jgi:hypothetical protein